jgi:hypothetical protein
LLIGCLVVSAVLGEGDDCGLARLSPRRKKPRPWVI